MSRWARNLVLFMIGWVFLFAGMFAGALITR